MATKHQMTNWEKQSLLSEEDLHDFQDDSNSKEIFESSFIRQKNRVNMSFVLIALLMVSNAYLENTFIFALTIIPFIYLFIAGAKLYWLKNRTQAICQGCSKIMCRYEYTVHNKDHRINGTVFICHQCNKKFIESEPDCTTL